jgi:uncharacterized membrane protein
MKSNTLALLIGGVLPAFLLGLSSIFQKTGNRAGIGTGPYLVVVGVVVLVIGLVITLVQRDLSWNRTSVLHSALGALLWGGGMFCIATALGRYNAQISQLVPLYNMNTLVAVGVGLVALGEWKSVHPAMIAAATVFTIAGGIFAALSSR